MCRYSEEEGGKDHVSSAMWGLRRQRGCDEHDPGGPNAERVGLHKQKVLVLGVPPAAGSGQTFLGVPSGLFLLLLGFGELGFFLRQPPTWPGGQLKTCCY